MRGRLPFAILALALAAAPCFSLSVSALQVTTSTLLVWSEESLAPELHGGPNPALAQLIGLSLPLSSGAFLLEPIVELYGLEYEYISAESRAIPTDDVTAAGFYVLGGIVSLHAGFALPLTSQLSAGASAGLDAVIRLPLDFSRTPEQTAAARDSARAFFYGAGRFFYPETRLFLDWKVSDAISLSFNLRAFYPLFHAWDQTGLGFLDQFMLSAGLGFGLRLGGGGKKTAAAPAEPAPGGSP